MEGKNCQERNVETCFLYGSIKTDDYNHNYIELSDEREKLTQQMTVFGGITVLSDDSKQFEIASGGSSIALSRVPLGLYAERAESRHSYSIAQRIADVAMLKAMLLTVDESAEQETEHFLDWRIDKETPPVLNTLSIIELFSKHRDVRVYYRMKEHHLLRILGAKKFPLMSDIQQYQMRLLLNIWLNFTEQGVIRFDAASNYMVDDLLSVNAIRLLV